MRNSVFSSCYYRTFFPVFSVQFFGSIIKQYWIDAHYASSTAQSTRTRGDLSRAFLHKKTTNLWGWHPDYIEILQSNLQKRRVNLIPAFHLAVWLYREREWSDDTTSKDIINQFIREFHIQEAEKEKLFDTSVPKDLDLSRLLDTERITWRELKEFIGLPPDVRDKGGILSLLELEGVGPAKALRIKFAERMNLITGDNGLGKTFILESAWWALSGSWTGSPIYPRDDAKKDEPKISFQISGALGVPETSTVKYDWRRQGWVSPRERRTIPGLLIYARVDGAFAIWDPARTPSSNPRTEVSNLLIFTREDVWDGLPSRVGGRTRYLCNGLINDWVSWQSNPDDLPFQTLKKVLKYLSPPDFSYGDLGILEPGEPMRIPGESRSIPTLRHPYGRVPLVYASASVRRIVALAYLIVWTWEEHKTQSELIREQPQKKMVILVDEIEAHLHPQWQRIILPALLDVLENLEKDLEVQFLIATHSPLVLASIEPRFDRERDKIFHLNLISSNLFDGEVVIEEPEFIPYGSANSWLMSDIFEMKQPRSIEAEKAIVDAKELQVRSLVTTEEVKEVSERLEKYLPPHDIFWPRWTSFAEQHGVDM